MNTECVEVRPGRERHANLGAITAVREARGRDAILVARMV